jgi:glucose-1-phosphate cytidylyltransferase
MKVVILCGGKGSRLSSPSDNTPKPLALVQGKPIIWHIMKIYDYFGYNDFILPLGFGGDKIKEYFYTYDWKNYDFIKYGGENKIKLLQQPEKWTITMIDTGDETMTGGRIKRIEHLIDEDTFMLTYGDGLCDINIDKLLQYHNNMGKIATVTGIARKSQYGVLTIKDGLALSFEEKSDLDGIINGGFFVFNKDIFKYIDNNDSCIFEQAPLKALTKDEQLAVYLHEGTWIAIDTYKDLMSANENWKPLI